MTTELNHFLQKLARKQIEQGIAACFVACPEDEPQRIAGYYTLSACSIQLKDLPEPLSKRLPHYTQVPATLLGRLARSLDFKGQGLGDLLMASALQRTLNSRRDVASYALVTDPKADDARSFYSSFGFMPLNLERLFLPLPKP